MQEKVIFVFPGQGAQYVGMGKDLFNEFAVARYTFQEMSDIAHRDVADICFNGAESELNKPENTSLGTFAHSVAIFTISSSVKISLLHEFNILFSSIQYIHFKLQFSVTEILR